MKPGTIVYDADSDDPIPTLAVVVHDTQRLARSVYIDALDETVAEYNPEYPEDDTVLEVQFMPSFLAWANMTYSYPESRLVVVESIDRYIEDNYPIKLNTLAYNRLKKFVKGVRSAYGMYPDLNERKP